MVAAVFNSAETGYEKPHPRAFEAVLEAFPSSDTFWMIGDNAHADVAGAEALGIPAILVRQPQQDIERYCEDLIQVAAIVMKD